MKKLILLILILAFSTKAYAGISVCEGANGRINRFELRGNPIQGCFYYQAGQDITLEKDAGLRALYGAVPFRHLKVVNGFPIEMSQAEKDAVDAQLQAAQDAIVLARRQQLGDRIVATNVSEFTLTQIDAAIDAAFPDPKQNAFMKKFVRSVIKLNEGNQ